MISRSTPLLVAAPLLVAPWWPFSLLKEATGAAALAVCSKGYISRIAQADVMRDHLLPEPGMGLIAWAMSIDVNAAQQEVRARVFGGFESRSVFKPGRGCTLTYDGVPEPKALSSSAGQSSDPFHLGASDVVEPHNPSLRSALDRAFAERRSGPPRRTQAVVIVHKGRIVAERYAQGLGPETPLLSHSIAKSVVNALIGILVQEGKLRVTDRAPIAAWKGDERASITVDQLLKMRAGFGFDEGSGASIATHIWHTEPNTAEAAAAAASLTVPGQQWGYCSRCYILLSRIIGDVVGGGPQGVKDFAERELFVPLGMRSVTLEFDAAGTMMGANAMYATPRDFARFGLLYLSDGRIGERRVLPTGWVEYSTQASPGTGYGAGFWLNNTSAEIGEWPIKWGIPGAPRDAFMARGYMGQYIVVVPSLDLVIVRMGQSHTPAMEIDSVGALVRDTAAIVQQDR
jgi:CubicO group peptidase (beta-lactamase class C family)